MEGRPESETIRAGPLPLAQDAPFPMPIRMARLPDSETNRRDTRSMRAALYALIAAGLVASLLVLFAIVDEPSKRESTSSRESVVAPPPFGLLNPLWRGYQTPDELPVVPPTYEAAFISAWVEGCVASGETMTFCRCAIDRYTAQLEPWEFETAAAVVRGGGELAELPEHLRGVVKGVERGCR